MGATAQSIFPTLAARNLTVNSMLVQLGKWESDQLGTPPGCLSSNHAAPFSLFFLLCFNRPMVHEEQEIRQEWIPRLYYIHTANLSGGYDSSRQILFKNK